MEVQTNQENFKLERNVGKINYYFFKSHLFWLYIKILLFFTSTTLLIHFTAIPLSTSIEIGIILLVLLIVDIVFNWKKIRFDLTFLYTVLSGGNEWWSPITEKIILGGIPLENHFNSLKEAKVTHILTLLQPFELKNGLIKPIDEKDLKELSIKKKIIHAEDFLGVPVKDIHEAVEHIHSIISSHANHKIYIHCKAGRGRSATIVVAYLLKYGKIQFKDLEEAYTFVKNKRPQINLNRQQKMKISEFLSRFFI